jgi:hypothetical protein
VSQPWQLGPLAPTLAVLAAPRARRRPSSWCPRGCERSAVQPARLSTTDARAWWQQRAAASALGAGRRKEPSRLSAAAATARVTGPGAVRGWASAAVRAAATTPRSLLRAWRSAATRASRSASRRCSCGSAHEQFCGWRFGRKRMQCTCNQKGSAVAIPMSQPETLSVLRPCCFTVLHHHGYDVLVSYP